MKKRKEKKKGNFIENIFNLPKLFNSKPECAPPSPLSNRKKTQKRKSLSPTLHSMIGDSPKVAYYDSYDYERWKKEFFQKNKGVVMNISKVRRNKKNPELPVKHELGIRVCKKSTEMKRKKIPFPLKTSNSQDISPHSSNKSLLSSSMSDSSGKLKSVPSINDYLLNESWDLNEPTTELFECIITGNTSRAKEIIQNEKEKEWFINYRNPDYDLKTAFHIACEYCQLEIMKFLLENGAKIECRDKHGRTPLHYAAKKGVESIACYLLANGHRIHLRDDYGHSPLHVCIKYHHFQLVESFILHGADINAITTKGSTILHECLEDRDQVAYDYILNHPKLSLKLTVKDVHENSSFYGNNGSNKELTKTNSSYHFKTTAKQNIFHKIATYGRSEIIENLVNVFSKRYSNQEILAALNEKDSNGQTPLHVATKYGHFEVVCTLIKLNVDMNVQDEEGNTPLHIALMKKHFEISQFLCMKGASHEIKNAQGLTQKDLYDLPKDIINFLIM